MDWSTKIKDYMEEPRIMLLHRKFQSSQYKADPSLSDELLGLLAFTTRHGKDRTINGPEDLATAEQILNEVNRYRDRAIEIHLSCLPIKAELDRGYQIIEQWVLIQPEIQGRGATESVKAAIVGQVADFIGDRISEWDCVLTQSEMLWRNCKAVYDNIHLQVETAKQMWFQDRSLSNSLDPMPDKRAAMTEGSGSETTHVGQSTRTTGPLASKMRV